MPVVTRKHTRRRIIVPLPPRGLRPRLTRDQLLDLGIVHAVNLDAIAKGEADEAMLWEWIGGVLTWSKVAELLATGEPEMRAQLELTERLIQRFARTGRVAFDGPDYQLAKTGLDVMDRLAEIVDRPTAIIAADWSEKRLQARLGEPA